MNDQDVAFQFDRITRYKELKARAEQIRFSIQILEESSTTSPFTGNTRESRKVDRMTIVFTASEGGDVPVTRIFDALMIPATALHALLTAHLREQWKIVQEAMAKL